MRGRTLKFALTALVVNIIAVITAVLLATRIGDYIEKLFGITANALANVNILL